MSFTFLPALTRLSSRLVSSRLAIVADALHGFQTPLLHCSTLVRIILKHVKRQIVSVEGGFQLISDLNAYHSFISSLRQPTVTAYFSSLKMVGEIYIVDSPKELGGLVRDVSRYEGTLSADDLYEIGASALPTFCEEQGVGADSSINLSTTPSRLAKDLGPGRKAALWTQISG